MAPGSDGWHDGHHFFFHPLYCCTSPGAAVGIAAAPTRAADVGCTARPPAPGKGCDGSHASALPTSSAAPTGGFKCTDPPPGGLGRRGGAESGTRCSTGPSTAVKSRVAPRQRCSYSSRSNAQTSARWTGQPRVSRLEVLDCAVPCSAVQCSAVLCRAVCCACAVCCVLRTVCRAVLCCAMLLLCSVVQCVLCCTVECSAVLYSVVVVQCSQWS